MKRNQLLRFLPFLLFIVYQAEAQIPEHRDFIGAGNYLGVRVSASDYHSKENRSNQADPISVLDGGGLEYKRMAAARFLAQAAFGGSPQEIEGLSKSLDFEKWIDTQTKVASTSMLQEVNRTFYTARNLAALQGSIDNYRNSDRHFHYAWWQSIMTKPDQLRQRVAMALSEILVISTQSTINNYGPAYASYYDIFTRNAFGNYKDILMEVTLHPSMGVYLTHFRNPKTDTTTQTFPDENYAREIMQLFTIGLHELNIDGSLKPDADGNPISTYSNEDIIELAKVFTGLGAGGLNENAIEQGRQLRFRTGQNDMDYTVPMKMYEDEHEPGEKFLIGDGIIPSGQGGLQDIEMAVNHLFNHPNVGPFIGRKLIQHFVTSNPSSAYIEDIASVFNDNGEGVRGDMLAVVKAILLHEEARECLWMNDPSHGKLKSPLLRYTTFARAVVKDVPNPFYFTDARGFERNTSQRILSSPSVFNFYSPDHIPNGPLADVGLYAPEFEIFNSVTSIGYVNEVHNWTIRGEIFGASELPEDVTLKKSYYLEMARDPEVLINHFDRILLQGRLKDTTRSILEETLLGLSGGDENRVLEQRVELALYLIMISPEFNILK